MAAETDTFKFKIGEDEYEMPTIDELDMDEWEIVYDYSGLVLDDFAPVFDAAGVLDEEAETERLRRLKRPGFTRALLHIGYRRGNPDMKDAAIRAITGKAKLFGLIEANASEGADVSPPESTTEPEPSSLRRPVASTENGSTQSPGESDQPGVEAAATGTP